MKKKIQIWQITAQAGSPGYDDDDDLDRLTIVPLACDPLGHSTVGVRVRGNSMKGDNLLNGDIAICWLTPFAPVGAVVLAMIPGGRVIKRLMPQADGSVLLCSSNPRFEPKPCASNEVRIMGIVKAVVRGNRQRLYQQKFDFIERIQVI